MTDEWLFGIICIVAGIIIGFLIGLLVGLDKR